MMSEKQGQSIVAPSRKDMPGPPMYGPMLEQSGQLTQQYVSSTSKATLVDGVRTNLIDDSLEFGNESWRKPPSTK